MSRTKNGSLPSYRLYKRTGQAVVTLDGKDHYLGEYGTLSSKQTYKRLIDAWLARQELARSTEADLPSLSVVTDVVSVNEVMLAYLRHAEAYYKPTAEGEQK